MENKKTAEKEKLTLNKMNENLKGHHKKVKEKIGTEMIKRQGAPIKEETSNELSNKKISESKKGEGKETKQTIKEKKKEQKKPKKTEAIVNGKSLPISTKKSAAVCRFIKGKNIQRAISDLEQVLAHKKAIPMKGEIPHQKGKGISSGGYSKKTAENFIKLLKSLQANANAGGLEEPVIVEAIANKASSPYGRFGRIKRKRSHIQIKVKEKKKWKKKA